MSMVTTTEPRIYVACLASYNDGVLHGKWIEAAQHKESLLEEIKEMIAEGPNPDGEEWAIHDYEGFEEITLSEYENLEIVSEIALALEKANDAWLLSAVYDLQGYSHIEQAENFIENNYLGRYDSLEDYAYQVVQDCYDLNGIGHLRNYIDYQALGRDMELSGDVITLTSSYGVVHVFSNY